MQGCSHVEIPSNLKPSSHACSSLGLLEFFYFIKQKFFRILFGRELTLRRDCFVQLQKLYMTLASTSASASLNRVAVTFCCLNLLILQLTSVSDLPSFSCSCIHFDVCLRAYLLPDICLTLLPQFFQTTFQQKNKSELSFSGFRKIDHAQDSVKLLFLDGFVTCW